MSGEPVTRAGRGDDGSAVVEFVGVTVVLLLPLLYLLLGVFAVQRSAFAVTQAARDAGRAYATAPSTAAGLERARYAAALALSDQGVTAAAEVRFLPAGADCGAAAGPPGPGVASLAPGTRFVACVRTRADLPWAGSVTVNGEYGVTVDLFRGARR